jgi:hypothetical protein
VLLPRIRRVELARAADPIEYNRTLTVRGPVALPLRFTITSV